MEKGPSKRFTSFSVNDSRAGLRRANPGARRPKGTVSILNASATSQHQIALAGHKFEVISLDGNPVPTPRTVEVLSLGPAERVDAVVTMNTPGVWILGELNDQIRNKVWESSSSTKTAAIRRAGLRPLNFTGITHDLRRLIRKRNPWNNLKLSRWSFAANLPATTGWTIGPSTARSTQKPIPFSCAKTSYRLRFDNQSDDDHPVHLHRHSFELNEISLAKARRASSRTWSSSRAAKRSKWNS